MYSKPSLTLFLNSALGPKGFDDGFIGLDIGAADQVDAIRYGSKDTWNNRFALGILQAFKGFFDGLGLTWQINDESGVPLDFS